MGKWERTGATDEWYTPPEVFDALNVRFDLDVASASRANVPARYFLTTHTSTEHWSGFIWMNPPYGGRNSLAPWCARFVTHGCGVALLPDRSSAPWFQRFAPQCDALLFTRKIKFIRPDGTRGKSPAQGSALWARGPEGVQALRNAAAANFGFLVIPEK